MKVEVAVLASPSLISLTVSVDVKRHSTNKCKEEGGGERGSSHVTNLVLFVRQGVRLLRVRWTLNCISPC